MQPLPMCALKHDLFTSKSASSHMRMSSTLLEQPVDLWAWGGNDSLATRFLEKSYFATGLGLSTNQREQPCPGLNQSQCQNSGLEHCHIGCQVINYMLWQTVTYLHCSARCVSIITGAVFFCFTPSPPQPMFSLYRRPHNPMHRIYVYFQQPSVQYVIYVYFHLSVSALA